MLKWIKIFLKLFYWVFWFFIALITGKLSKKNVAKMDLKEQQKKRKKELEEPRKKGLDEKDELTYLEPLSFTSVEEYIDILKKLGWFKDLPEEAEGVLVQCLKKDAPEPAEYPWNSNTYHYDAECIYDEGDHIRLVEGISTVSFGTFKPVAIKESWERTATGLVITLIIQTAAKTYRKSWPYECDYISGEFYAFMDHVVRDHTKKLCLRSLPGGQDGSFIICSPAAFKKAVLHRVMPWELRLEFLDKSMG